MVLTRIARNVYSMNGNDLASSVYSPPVLAVHPYFKCRMDIDGGISFWSSFRSLQGRLQIDETDPYIQRFENLVKDLDRPLIAFEEACKVDMTVERFRRLGRSERTYFVKTRLGLARPKGISVPRIWTPWDSVVNFLAPFEQPIDLAGGKYDEENPDDWCLGAVANLLKHVGLQFRIIKEATFY